MKVEITPEAKADILRGYDFYEIQSPGLGDYFRRRILQDIDSLEDFGGIHEKHLGFHRTVSKKFPYLIYYSVSVSLVTVIAVLDGRSNPDWIERRLSS